MIVSLSQNLSADGGVHTGKVENCEPSHTFFIYPGIFRVEFQGRNDHFILREYYRLRSYSVVSEPSRAAS